MDQGFNKPKVARFMEEWDWSASYLLGMFEKIKVAGLEQQ